MSARFDRQQGASMVEFTLAAPVLLLLGLGTLQIGLIYHGKATVNYATLEAARTGAVRHAQLDPMLDELAIRLAPLEGGDGSAAMAAAAIAKSTLSLANPLHAHVKILSPTVEAFGDWGVTSKESGRRVIPNSHLGHWTNEIKASSGVSIRDANLLKIEVTHGFDLEVPLIADVLSRAMLEIDKDPAHAPYYLAKKLPLKSYATVRMQSEAWEDAIVSASAAPQPGDEGFAPDTLADEVLALGAESGDVASDGDADGDPMDAGDSCGGPFGLSSDPSLPTADLYACSGGVLDSGGGPGDLLAGGDAQLPSSGC